MQSPTIVLTTDFGLFDPYVAMMKGVILNICNDAKLIDMTHTIEPHNIKQAAYILANSIKFFPEGTVFVTVVDPGVGSERQPIAIKAANRYFVAPNNGVLSYIINEHFVEESVLLDKKEYFLEVVSKTFHGRDIFAPTSAHIAAGKELHQVGSHIEINKLISLAKPKLFMDDNSLTGEIVHIDRFGNLITNLKDNMIAEADLNEIIFTVGETEIVGLKEKFADVAEREALVYTGSNSFLEIAVRNANAEQILDAKIGDNVKVLLSGK